MVVLEIFFKFGNILSVVCDGIVACVLFFVFFFLPFMLLIIGIWPSFTRRLYTLYTNLGVGWEYECLSEEELPEIYLVMKKRMLSWIPPMLPGRGS